MTKKTNESGRTMLEMLGVLAIMGVIMYGAIAGISFGVEMYQINATYNQIEEISEGIVELYSWSRSYGDADTNLAAEVCKNDITDCYSTGGVRSYLGGATVSVNVDSCSGDGCGKFKITYTGLSYLACTRLKDNAAAGGTGKQYRHVTCSVYPEDAECVSGNNNRLDCVSR